MRTESYSSIYTITDRNYYGDESNSVFQVRRKIPSDYPENLVLKRIDQQKVKNFDYLENLFRSKLINIISPLDIFKNQGKKQNELVAIYRDFVLQKLNQQIISTFSLDLLRKIILQLAITMSELTKRRLFWPLFSVEQLYLINDCLCISSLDLNLQHYDLQEDNFQSFKNFVNLYIVSDHKILKQVVDGYSFEQVIQQNLVQQGLKFQADQLMNLPKFHPALQIYFDINEGINRTVGFLEPFHFEFKTPELFQQLYPGTSNKIVYKAIQLDQADREQLLINQEREIQMTEILDGCPQLAVGFCYLRVFDQAFFFMNKPVMTLEKGFKQLNTLSVQDNKKVVYKMCWQLSKGLDKMHSQNIMHRNINPGNITMDHEEILKANLSIAEFDRSKKAEQKASSKSIIIQPSTQANCNSTFSYMPPDDPEKYTIKADLFQFGVVALQLANKGQYFGKGFFGLSVDEFEEFYGQEIIREQLKSLEYDDRFIECIGSCIKLNPQQRPNTNELSRTLYQVYLSSKIRIMYSIAQLQAQRNHYPVGMSYLYTFYKQYLINQNKWVVQERSM